MTCRLTLFIIFKLCIWKIVRVTTFQRHSMHHLSTKQNKQAMTLMGQHYTTLHPNLIPIGWSSSQSPRSRPKDNDSIHLCNLALAVCDGDFWPTVWILLIWTKGHDSCQISTSYPSSITPINNGEIHWEDEERPKHKPTMSISFSCFFF